MELNDTDLVDLTLKGDKEAFSELVLRHQDAIYNLAYRLAGNHTDAAEIAQDAFVRAYGKLTQYRKEYSFPNWVMGICANQAKNLFRARDRRHKAELASVDSSPAATEAPLDAVNEALRQLPEHLRLPVVLKHMEGLSYDEIGNILRIGVSAAKMRVKRGLERLVQSVRFKQKEAACEIA